MGEVKAERKTRSDKKRCVQPTIDLKLYDAIARLAYICDRPIKDAGEMIAKDGLKNQRVMEALSARFRRDFWWSENRLIRGVIDREPVNIKVENKGIEKRRITLRLDQCTHDRLSDLAYALDTTVASATGLLLETAMKNTTIVNDYITKNVREKLDQKRMKQLEEILRYMNANNPYEERVSIAALISAIVDDFLDTTRNVKEVLHQWIDGRFS